MSMLLSQALGGEAQPGARGGDGAKDVTEGASTVEEAVNRINAMFSA